MDGIRKIEDPKLDKNLVADRSQRYKYAAGSDQLRKARGRARCQFLDQASLDTLDTVVPSGRTIPF